MRERAKRTPATRPEPVRTGAADDGRGPAEQARAAAAEPRRLALGAGNAQQCEVAPAVEPDDAGTADVHEDWGAAVIEHVRDRHHEPVAGHEPVRPVVGDPHVDHVRSARRRGTERV